MAKHVDTADAVTPGTDVEAAASSATSTDSIAQDNLADENDVDAGEGTVGVIDSGEAPQPAGRSWRRRMTLKKVTVSLGVLLLLSFTAAAGWQGFRVQKEHRASAQRDLLVETARQAAVNLTTIDFADINTDVGRILDSATGNFHDEFQQRSKAFADVVTEAQSKSEGTVTAAGIESQSGDSAQVLVAVNVETTVKGSTQPDPRAWRMRITVVGASASPKVSDVQFVP